MFLEAHKTNQYLFIFHDPWELETQWNSKSKPVLSLQQCNSTEFPITKLILLNFLNKHSIYLAYSFLRWFSCVHKSYKRWIRKINNFFCFVIFPHVREGKSNIYFAYCYKNFPVQIVSLYTFHLFIILPMPRFSSPIFQHFMSGRKFFDCP